MLENNLSKPNNKYLSVVSSVQSLLLNYGYEWNKLNKIAHLDTFFNAYSVLAHGDVYEVWFGELSNAVITPLYNGAYEPTGALVTLVLGSGWGVDTFSFNLESLNDEEELKEMHDWILKTLNGNKKLNVKGGKYCK
tara:strand:- start:1080 stop:1487 length:408 start_codon:yes stop_codon:yes gene_type:complete